MSIKMIKLLEKFVLFYVKYSDLSKLDIHNLPYLDTAIVMILEEYDYLIEE